MKSFSSLLCSVLTILAWTAGGLCAQDTAPSPTPASQTGGETAAQAGAEVWLALTDDARYDAAYMGAAGIFQKIITKEQWVKLVTAGRGPLGKVSSRKFKDAKFSPKMNGAPDGQYVVLHFDTVFEKKPAAVETLTTTIDTDGQWKVCGYFIR